MKRKGSLMEKKKLLNWNKVKRVWFYWTPMIVFVYVHEDDGEDDDEKETETGTEGEKRNKCCIIFLHDLVRQPRFFH